MATKLWSALGGVLIASLLAGVAGVACSPDPGTIAETGANPEANSLAPSSGILIPADTGMNFMDLADYSDAPPKREIPLVFLHHSVGGALLENGGLRDALTKQGYSVHEATYGSGLGQDTDLFHWLPKFRDQMDEILQIRHQDETLPNGQTNEVVMFKSCFPNNWFVGEGNAPGDPAGPELTLANAQATLTALRDPLEKSPEVMFVYLTAPPVAPRIKPDPGWKSAMKKVLGRSSKQASLAQSAALARKFNRWVMDTEKGWLAGYSAKNIVVFDYYDLLTAGGRSDLSAYASGDGFDSHPNDEGQRLATERLVPFLNRSARRAGILH